MGPLAKALDFFGGVPQLIVPDNPKAMISRSDRYEPKMSATVQDFARHYSCSILPASLRHPQYKAKVVEVSHRGARVTSHTRCAHKGGYSTQVEHLSVAHRKHLEWTPHRLVHLAQSIGSTTGALVERLLGSHRHPEHGYRSCLGLLSLARRFSEARLEAACEVALSLGTCRYQHVKDNLQNGRDKASAPVADKWQSPEHAHVRGAKYYQ